MITHSETAAPATIQERYGLIRSQTEKICRPLQPEDTVVQPMVDVSPPKWHLAHTTWFFETFVLKKFKSGYKVCHPDYNFLFNSYYNSIGSRVIRSQRGTLTRPLLAEIYAYREYVDWHLKAFLHEAGDDLPEEVLPVLELGLQHEQQHQELLVTDLKYILSTNPLLPAYLPPAEKPVALNNTPVSPKFLTVPGGMYEIGYQGQDFCFDNELNVHPVFVNEFGIRNTLVTNAEYLEFMNAGGYTDFRHWLGEGYEMATTEHWEAPLYWLKKEGQWHRFTHYGLQPVDLHAPVCHISFYEADAFANWAGKRLLTEFEWEAASNFFRPGKENGNWLESGHLDPQPPSEAFGGCHHLLGNVWEWTYSGYFPYPGYTKAEGALGEYNGKFMINQMVLRGGSCATPQSHIRPTYRNFFHADKRWQFTGIRLAEK